MSICTGSSSTAASTASPTAVAPGSARTPARFDWVSWVYARPNGSATTTTSPTAGVMTCGWSRSSPPRRGGAVPECVGGRRAGPPEDCGGPWAFLEQTQPHLVFDAMLRAAEIVGMLLEEQDTEVTRVGEHRDELAALLPLLGLERFDRRALNHALAGITATQTRVA